VELKEEVADNKKNEIDARKLDEHSDNRHQTLVERRVALPPIREVTVIANDKEKSRTTDKCNIKASENGGGNISGDVRR